MPFDDLSIGLRTKFIELVEDLEKGIYKAEFRGITGAIGVGPQVYLYYSTDEQAKTIDLPSRADIQPIQKLEELGYIVANFDLRNKNQFTATLTSKSKEQYSLYLAPCNFRRIVTDLDLAKVLQDRWEESSLTLKNGAYLSTIILLGSILEGILLDVVKSNPIDAGRVSGAKRDNRGNLIPFEKWHLNDLIIVSYQCGWIGRDRNDFADTLREYRNFVHPNEQATRGIDLDNQTCSIAKKVVEAILQDLDRRFT